MHWWYGLGLQSGYFKLELIVSICRLIPMPHSQRFNKPGEVHTYYCYNNNNFLWECSDVPFRFQIIAEICVEILVVEPNKVCIDSTFEIALTGSGFSKTSDSSRARCRFTTTDTGMQWSKSIVRKFSR